jgi:hypothetical protein
LKRPENAGPGAPALRRRDFLALGSIAALAPLTPLLDRAAAATNLSAAPVAPPAGPAGEGQAAHQPGASPKLPFSIGYLEGSQELSNLRKLDGDLRLLTVVRRSNTFTIGRHVLPAHAMPAGDPALVGGPVRMTIHDLYPKMLPQAAADAAKWPVAVDLDVAIPLLEPPRGSTALYLAWSYRRLPAEDRSARVSFLLWPDWYSDLTLTARVVPAGARAVPRLHQASFSLGADQGRPKLLKGIYLLGLQPGVWDEDLELPEDPSRVPPELLSVLVTIEPEGVRRGTGRSG